MKEYPREQIKIATKGSHYFDENNDVHQNNDPEFIKNLQKVVFPVPTSPYKQIIIGDFKNFEIFLAKILVSSILFKTMLNSSFIFS